MQIDVSVEYPVAVFIVFFEIFFSDDTLLGHSTILVIEIKPDNTVWKILITYCGGIPLINTDTCLFYGIL